MLKFLHMAPIKLKETFIMNNTIHQYNLQGSDTNVLLSHPKTEYLKESFSFRGAKILHSLSVQVINSESLPIFAMPA